MAYPTTDNVLLVYNSATTANPNFSDITQSQDIANYAETTFPGVHKIGISVPDSVRTGTYGEDIARADYESYIRDVIRQAIIDGGWNIYYIVLCKGIPHRIPGSGTTYSSVDCELCTLEDDYNGVYDPYTQTIDNCVNPFWGSHSLFVPGVWKNIIFSGDGVSFLVTRLDGYTVAQVKAMIDKASAPFVGGDAWCLLDDDPTKGYDQMGDAHSRLDAIGGNNNYDNTNVFITTASGDVIGYVGHGIHHINAPPSGATYILDDLSFVLKNGAIFSAYESFGCWSFGKYDGSASGRNGQGQISDWIQIGGSGGCGFCYEPYTSSIPHEQIFLPEYAEGFPFADAFYSSLFRLSWVSIIIGWPLMRISTLPSAPTGLNSSRVGNTITVTWNANPEYDLAGYKVYWDVDSGIPYSYSQNVGDVLTYNIDISGAPLAIYFISVSAYNNMGGESSLANEITNSEGRKVMGRLHQQGTALVGGDVSGGARGDYAIDIQSNRTLLTAITSGVNSVGIGRELTVSGNDSVAIGNTVTISGLKSYAIGYANTVSGYYSVAIGSSITVSGSYSTAIGYNADVTAAENATAIGYQAIARINNTVNIGGPQINRKDNGESAANAFESFCGVEVVLLTKEVDLKAVAAHTITLPAGCKFWIKECGLIATAIDTLTVQPTVSYGITGNTTKHGAALITTNITAAGKMEIETPTVPGDGETSLVGDVTVVATATTALGRFYFSGKLVETE